MCSHFPRRSVRRRRQTSTVPTPTSLDVPLTHTTPVTFTLSRLRLQRNRQLESRYCACSSRSGTSSGQCPRDRVGDLDPKVLTVRRSVGLGQKLYWIDLCGMHPIHAPRNTATKREGGWTYARRIPGFVLIDSGNEVQGDVGEEKPSLT